METLIRLRYLKMNLRGVLLKGYNRNIFIYNFWFHHSQLIALKETKYWRKKELWVAFSQNIKLLRFFKYNISGNILKQLWKRKLRKILILFGINLILSLPFVDGPFSVGVF